MFISWFKRTPKKDLLGGALKMMQAGIKVDFDFEAYANKHIFNRLSKSSEYGFYYFPYSYLFRYPKWGTINEMGFRCRESIYEIRALYPDHVVVAVFGGSTGFSILVPDEDTFAAQMEKMLNADADLFEATGRRRFKVVNLSHPGNLVLNQIVNYILYCHDLNPDIVISHSGCNDLATGQVNDRFLISRYAIGYPDIMEAWGRKIHDCEDVKIDHDFSAEDGPGFTPVKPKNRPEDVVHAYHTRVVQFARLVKGNNAHFISGFQPWLMSKKGLSETEEKARSGNFYGNYYQFVYNNVPMLCDLYEQLLEKLQLDYVVNLHRAFSHLDGNVTHFGDVCHTLAPGDRVIAEQYCLKIRSLYQLPGKNL